MRDIDQITGEIISAAYGLHNRLGPGLLESVYETLLARALEQRGLAVERQKPIALEIDGARFSEGFRLDLLVESQVIVELKSVEKLAPIHSKQVLTYLRLLNLNVALLINFNVTTLRDGLRRIVNGYVPLRGSHLRVNQPTPE